jgi:hypothetical protein
VAADAPRRAGGTLLRHTTQRGSSSAHPSGSAHPHAAAAQGSAIAMPDLLAVYRSPARGAQPTRAGTLATGFGASELIRPAGSAAADVAMPPSAGVESTSGAGGVRSLARSGAARGTDSSVHGTDLAPDRAGAADVRRAVGPADRRTGTARAYLPAPPPVSIRRTPLGAAQSGPPVPASARALASTASATAMGGAVRRSLVDSTAHLFSGDDAESAAMQQNGDQQRGTQMTQSLPAGMSIVRPGEAAVAERTERPAEPSILQDPGKLEELVDKVVDRIERRVVDELERRGHRHTPGAF